MWNIDLEIWFLCSPNHRYHDNAFVASRALHIASNLNASATFPLLEWFFKHQVCIRVSKSMCLMHAFIEDIIMFTHSFGHCELEFHFSLCFRFASASHGLVKFRTLFFPVLVIFIFSIQVRQSCSRNFTTTYISVLDSNLVGQILHC